MAVNVIYFKYYKHRLQIIASVINFDSKKVHFKGFFLYCADKLFIADFILYFLWPGIYEMKNLKNEITKIFITSYIPICPIHLSSYSTWDI